ncbi:MAG: hypothetical protein VXW32_09030 [Myxococcota bacterium]|nr:hypothetical protein [Myxococcota bacterium]
MNALLLGLLLQTGTADAATAGRAVASSTFVDDEGVRHLPRLAMDGLMASGWGEGESQDETWLEIDLGKTQAIREVSIWPGNLSEGKKSFKEYARPKTIVVELRGRGEPVTKELVLEDRMHRLDIPIEGSARKIRVRVKDRYEGMVFSDLFIAEVGINFNESAEAISRLVEWVRSTSADRAHDAHETKVIDTFNAIREAEFGDQEKLDILMRWAGDGADYIRRKALQLVDAGYLASAIRPDFDAVDAIRKLKDPNAIPALELAMLRLSGDKKSEMQDLVQYFYAYQSYIGGPRRNIRYWGEPGWELGALQSFGEPVPVEVDPEGNVFVADIGNNRIQRFSADGRPERQWGPEAGITSEWFDTGRPFYVSGAQAGDAPGQFVTPLDVALIPMDDGVGFAAVDALGRVQVFDAEGRGLIGWRLYFRSEVNAGVGGVGYIAYVPKKERLYVIMGRDMAAFTMDGEEVLRVVLEDGAPNAVEVAPKNYLMMVYGRDVIRYDLDGFRFGEVLSREQLGSGYEDMDITVDENRNIWLVTDTGWAYKYDKKLKKQLLKLKLSDVDLIHPRIAVFENYVYVVDRDRILRLDAEQARLDALEAEE